jgi:hypothetical protein
LLLRTDALRNGEAISTSSCSLIAGLLKMLSLSLDLTLAVHILSVVAEPEATSFLLRLASEDYSITIMIMSCPCPIPSTALLVDCAEKSDQVDALI